jgi:hypothetical protein
LLHNLGSKKVASQVPVQPLHQIVAVDQPWKCFSQSVWM